MELPKTIESYILETYNKSDDSHWKNGFDLLDWYRRWAKAFLDTGIPEDGVIELMKKHPVPFEMVRRYGFSSGLMPESVAQNILKYRHNPVEYDPLAKPRIRVTKKKIADFRVDLEKEMRRIWDPNYNSLEEYIKEFCYQPTDEEISSFIKHGTKAEGWARTIFEYL